MLQAVRTTHCHSGMTDCNAAMAILKLAISRCVTVYGISVMVLKTSHFKVRVTGCDKVLV